MIIDNGAYPSPLGYCGYPKSVCTSVNECICHGIPDSRPLEVSQPKSSSNNFWHMENSYNSSSLWQDGDIINIDVTVYLNVSQSKLICTSWNEERNHCDYLSFINALHLFFWITFVMIFSRDVLLFWFLAWSCTSFHFHRIPNDFFVVMSISVQSHLFIDMDRCNFDLLMHGKLRRSSFFEKFHCNCIIFICSITGLPWWYICNISLWWCRWRS